MNRFVTIKKPKELAQLICDRAILEKIQKTVENCETLCLYGDSGVGKTFLVDHVLKGRHRFDLLPETFKDLERVENSSAHIVVDDIELDKEFLEKLKLGHKFSKGSLILIARTPGKIEGPEKLLMGHPDLADIVKIGLRQRPKETVARLSTLARACNGNIRTFLYSLDFSASRDIFKTPKDFVSDLLCPSSDNPRNYLGQVVSEHGYVWGVVHDNYVDAPGADFVKIAECMSVAEILDTHIYDGNWEILPFFCLVSTVIPAIEVNQCLDKTLIRPGSAWTKYGNYKMRRNKLNQIQARVPQNLDVDSIKLLVRYCKLKSPLAVPLLKSYSIKPPDIDVINHLVLSDKLTQKEIQNLKKALATSDPGTS